MNEIAAAAPAGDWHPEPGCEMEVRKMFIEPLNGRKLKDLTMERVVSLVESFQAFGLFGLVQGERRPAPETL